MSREIALDVMRAAFAEFGTDGSYTDPVGQPVDVRFRLVTDGEDVIGFAEHGPLGRAPVIRVMADDLTPVEGGVFASHGQAWTVSGRPRKADRYRLAWTCRVDAQ